MFQRCFHLDSVCSDFLASQTEKTDIESRFRAALDAPKPTDGKFKHGQQNFFSCIMFFLLHLAMANTIANRRYVEQLEADAKKLKQEKTAAEAIATLADERMKAAYSAKDEVLAEKSRVQEQLAVCQVEKAALEEQLHRTERRLQDENSALQSSVHQAAERTKELQAQLESMKKGSTQNVNE